MRAECTFTPISPGNLGIAVSRSATLGMGRIHRSGAAPSESPISFMILRYARL